MSTDIFERYRYGSLALMVCGNVKRTLTGHVSERFDANPRNLSN